VCASPCPLDNPDVILFYSLVNSQSPEELEQKAGASSRPLISST